jgi:hypothetical protein
MMSRPSITLFLIVVIAASPALARGSARTAFVPPALDVHQVLAHTDRAATPFKSNGCSGFREAKFFSCCFVHDLAFWSGGTWSDRRQADLVLRRCIVDISNGYIANFSYFLVRLAVVPGAIVNDGWGRAWQGSKRKRFAALTDAQKARVTEERQRVCRSLVLNPLTGQYLVDETREIRPQQAREVCDGEPPSRRGQ